MRTLKLQQPFPRPNAHGHLNLLNTPKGIFKRPGVIDGGAEDPQQRQRQGDHQDYLHLSRQRDVFLFTRNVVHTFSTGDESMVLLSCQLPFLAFDDERQYRLPSYRWIAREQPERKPPTVACDPAWSVLAGQLWNERVVG